MCEDTRAVTDQRRAVPAHCSIVLDVLAQNGVGFVQQCGCEICGLKVHDAREGRPLAVERPSEIDRGGPARRKLCKRRVECGKLRIASVGCSPQDFKSDAIGCGNADRGCTAYDHTADGGWHFTRRAAPTILEAQRQQPLIDHFESTVAPTQCLDFCALCWIRSTEV